MLLPLGLTLALLLTACGSVPSRVQAPSAQVCFTPSENCAGQVVELLNGAQREILVQAYSFTSVPIAKGLTGAHRRGVAVTVILDKSQSTEQDSLSDFLAHAGIPTYIDPQHARAHSKVILIDDETLITSSFDFTRAAQRRNAENVLVLAGDRRLLQRYRENFDTHRGHSERYTGH